MVHPYIFVCHVFCITFFVWRVSVETAVALEGGTFGSTILLDASLKDIVSDGRCTIERTECTDNHTEYHCESE